MGPISKVRFGSRAGSPRANSDRLRMADSSPSRRTPEALELRPKRKFRTANRSAAADATPTWHGRELTGHRGIGTCPVVLSTGLAKRPVAIPPLLSQGKLQWYKIRVT